MIHFQVYKPSLIPLLPSLLLSSTRRILNIIFHGNYTIAKALLVGSNERMKMRAHEVWKVAEYWFLWVISENGIPFLKSCVFVWLWGEGEMWVSALCTGSAS